MENIVLTEIFVAMRWYNRLLKRIVAIQNGYTNPSFIKTYISEDTDYIIWTELQYQWRYWLLILDGITGTLPIIGGVPTL